MIKFFRKIRYNLLNEGKTSRYLKYAIGEILLIMIGIFMAIQLQNWNENRKQEAEAEIVLEQIYNAIKNDTEIFKTHEIRISEQIKLIDILLKTPDTLSTEDLPYILSFLGLEDINSYKSEATYHTMNLKYNPKKLELNELSKQIRGYVNSVEVKLNYVQDPIIPILDEEELRLNTQFNNVIVRIQNFLYLRSRWLIDTVEDLEKLIKDVETEIKRLNTQ